LPDSHKAFSVDGLSGSADTPSNQFLFFLAASIFGFQNS
jgi:hypothetical protein